MDNYGTSRSDVVEPPKAAWGPKPAVLTVGALVSALSCALSVYFALTGDNRGAVLLGIVAALFTTATAHATLLRPRLAASTDGIAVRTMSGRRTVPWLELDARLMRGKRLGRDTLTLELDVAGEHPALFVFGELELGTDPRDVQEELERLRG